MIRNTSLIEKAVITFAILTVIIPLAIFYSILPKPTINNCSKELGFVSKVVNGSGKRDIVIGIQGSDRYYYINRAVERGLSADQLSEQILNKHIEVMTINHFIFFDPTGITKHIAQIKSGGVVIYTEM